MGAREPISPSSPRLLRMPPKLHGGKRRAIVLRLSEKVWDPFLLLLPPATFILQAAPQTRYWRGLQVSSAHRIWTAWTLELGRRWDWEAGSGTHTGLTSPCT